MLQQYWWADFLIINWAFSLLSDLMGKSHILSRFKKKKKPSVAKKFSKVTIFVRPVKIQHIHSVCWVGSVTQAPFPVPCCHLGLHRCSGRAEACKQEVLFIVSNKSSPVNFSSIQDQVGEWGENQYLLRGEVQISRGKTIICWFFREYCK